MSMITAILEPSEDGTLHLPIPDGLPSGKVEVVATLRPVSSPANPLRAGCLKGFWVSSDFDAPLEDFAEYS
jgi:hypothetical protein